MNEIILEKIKNKLVISAQAMPFEPLYEESAMFALIDTIVNLGKINALRLSGSRDISYVKNKYQDDVIVIGITKPDRIPVNYKELVYITPNPDKAYEIINSGADIIAFDGTIRNKNLYSIIDCIHSRDKIAMADIATFEDAENAVKLGADIISTTLSGYTLETADMPDVPDFELLKKCVSNFSVPVILEGKIWSKDQVRHAFELGAHSVVIGSAVTRPHKIIEKFKEGLL